MSRPYIVPDLAEPTEVMRFLSGEFVSPGAEQVLGPKASRRVVPSTPSTGAVLSFYVSKTELYIGELVRVEGVVLVDTTPVPNALVEVLSDAVVIGSAFTDSLGRFSTYVAFAKSGVYRVTARSRGVVSRAVEVTVTAPPPPPPPIAPAKPEATVPEITAAQFEQIFRKAIREEGEEAFRVAQREELGIKPDYLYKVDTLGAGSSLELDIVLILKRVGKEGYLMNDHDTESLWLTVNRLSAVEVKAGEVYPLFKRDVSYLKIENRTSASIPYRLEVR